MKMHDKLRVTEVANLLGYSVKTIQRWADQNLLRPLVRSAMGHRRFTRQEVERFRTTFLKDGGGTFIRCPHCGRPVTSFAVREGKPTTEIKVPARRIPLRSRHAHPNSLANLKGVQVQSASKSAAERRIKRNQRKPPAPNSPADGKSVRGKMAK